MVEKVMRRVVQKARKWLEEESQGTTKHAGSLPKQYSYQWLNHVLFPSVLKKGWRPHYTWGVLQGVNLARALGIKRVSVIEFGVAGGNGLVALEDIVSVLEPVFGVEVDIYGFDTGVGLPKPDGYRDLPNVYAESQCGMDVEKLKKRLRKAQLVLGLVEHTIDDFIRSRPAPVAFISDDLDYYTASMEAFKIFEATQELLLPRIWCYFDDIMGPTKCDFTGERLAIADFNASHEMRKISPIYGLPWALPKNHFDQVWVRKMFLAHMFDHEKYGQFDELTPMDGPELKLKG